MPLERMPEKNVSNLTDRAYDSCGNILRAHGTQNAPVPPIAVSERGFCPQVLWRYATNENF
jgi:hypothetical protein